MIDITWEEINDIVSKAQTMERERIVALLEREASELEGHDCADDCGVRAEELRLSVLLINGDPLEALRRLSEKTDERGKLDNPLIENQRLGEEEDGSS